MVSRLVSLFQDSSPIFTPLAWFMVSASPVSLYLSLSVSLFLPLSVCFGSDGWMNEFISLPDHQTFAVPIPLVFSSFTFFMTQS